jgi:hypothetical protein
MSGATTRSVTSTGFEKIDIPEKDKIRIKWTTKFEPFYVREEWKKFSLYHSCQDVLTPFAILVKIALEITEL